MLMLSVLLEAYNISPLLISLVIYSIRRIYQFYWFQDGYVIETMYDGTDVPGPEEIGITNYQRY